MKLSNELAKNFPVPDEYLVELGRITALWGSLETSLNTGIGKLAGFNNLADPTPFILLAHSSFPQRLDMLSSLCSELSTFDKNLEGYSSVVGQLKAAQAQRNRYSHNSIHYDQELQSCFISVGSARGKLKFETTKVSIAQIREVSESIHVAMLALHKLITGVSYPPIWERPTSK